MLSSHLSFVRNIMNYYLEVAKTVTRRKMFFLFSILIFITGSSAWTQLGPEYWTSIYHGRVGPEVRSVDDFMTFDKTDGWIAYWIDRPAHYEAFGHAFRRPDGRICAFFATPENTSIMKCGGFRVLTNNQIDTTERNAFRWVIASEAIEEKSVGYQAHYVARLESTVNERYGGAQYFYGDALLDITFFIGVDPRIMRETTHVTESDYFDSNVWILQKN